MSERDKMLREPRKKLILTTVRSVILSKSKASLLCHINKRIDHPRDLYNSLYFLYPTNTNQQREIRSASRCRKNCDPLYYGAVLVRPPNSFALLKFESRLWHFLLSFRW
jgi:hypothetical protein